MKLNLKKPAVLLGSLALAFTLAACSNSDTDDREPAKTDGTPSASPEANPETEGAGFVALPADEDVVNEYGFVVEDEEFGRILTKANKAAEDSPNNEEYNKASEAMDPTDAESIKSFYEGLPEFVAVMDEQEVSDGKRDEFYEALANIFKGMEEAEDEITPAPETE